MKLPSRTNRLIAEELDRLEALAQGRYRDRPALERRALALAALRRLRILTGTEEKSGEMDRA